jgi:hypothetical protein
MKHDKKKIGHENWLYISLDALANSLSEGGDIAIVEQGGKVMITLPCGLDDSRIPERIRVHAGNMVKQN